MLATALVLMLPPCISLAIGDPLSFEEPFDLLPFANLFLSIVAAVLLLRPENLMAFCHVVALWAITIAPQFAVIASKDAHIGSFFYRRYSVSELIEANFVIMLWIVIFVLAYKLSFRNLKLAQRSISIVSRRAVYVATILGFAGLAYYLVRVGGLVFTRGQFDALDISDSILERHLVLYPLRALPYFALLFAYTYSVQQGTWRVVDFVMFFVLLIVTLIVNNPLAAARNFLGSVALACLYVLFLRKARSNISFLLLLVGAIYFVFPFNTRNITTLEDSVNALSWDLEQIFLSDFLRSWETVPAAVAFVNAHGHTSMMQFLGNLLFFVPRFLWPSKPVGSGTFMVVTEFGNNMFSNVSCTLPCEGFINLGYSGVALLAVVFGVVLAVLDKLLAQIKSVGIGRAAFVVYYGFLLGTVVFITRGDLLSPLAIAASFSISYLVLWQFCTRIRPKVGADSPP